MNETFCSLLTFTPEYVSIRCNPYRQILVWQLKREDEEHGTSKENVKQQGIRPIGHGHKNGAAHGAIIHRCLVYLCVYTIGYFLLLYASWFCLCQAVAVLYAKQSGKLVGDRLMLGKFTVDSNKELTAQNVEASSSTTLLFPRYDPEPLNVTKRNEISLMVFIEARQ